MIGRKEKSKEKKYREDETDNDNINLKDSPKLIIVLKIRGEGVTFYLEKLVITGFITWPITFLLRTKIRIK